MSPSSTIYLSPRIDFIALDIICCAATLVVGAAFVIPCARLCVDSARLVPGVKFTEETGMKLDQPVVWNTLCRLTTIARVDKFTTVVINLLKSSLFYIIQYYYISNNNDIYVCISIS